MGGELHLDRELRARLQLAEEDELPELVRDLLVRALDPPERQLAGAERRQKRRGLRSGDLLDAHCGAPGATAHSETGVGKVGAAWGAERRYTMNVRRYSITVVPSWFTPRVRIETMPTSGFEDDGRTDKISVSAHSVSPAKTGWGSLTSVHARFAVAFSLVSGTLSPTTSESVKQLFTSGFSNRV